MNGIFCFEDRYRSQYGAGVGMYQYIHDDDENTFQIVDSSRVPKPAFQKRSRYQQNVNQNGLSVIQRNFCQCLAF